MSMIYKTPTGMIIRQLTDHANYNCFTKFNIRTKYFKQMKKLFLFITCLVMINILTAQTPKMTGLQAITKEAIRGQLEFLASDWMEGRATATKGEYLSGDYIASMFKIFGIQPYGDRESFRSGRGFMPSGRMTSQGMPVQPRTYFQNVNMIEYEPGEEQDFSIITKSLAGESTVDFNYKTDFSVRTGTVGLSALSQVVFAGYGYTNEKNGYDDYKKLDVKGKVVLILQGYPGYKDVNSEAFKKFKPEGRRAEFSMERDKITHAGKLGAVAVIQVRAGDDPTRDWVANQIYPIKGRFYEADAPLQSSNEKRMALQEDTLKESVSVFTVTQRVINQLIDGTGINFESFEKVVCEKMIPASVVLPGKYVHFKTTVESRIVKSRNVLGYIEGEKKNELVVIGAHYDHLGKSDGWIWNGADDNASGTVGVMTIAKAMAASGKKPEKTIVFAAWSGEEKGLLGSKNFVSRIPDSLKVAVYLNYDMISRNEDADTLGNTADLGYTEAFPGIKELTKKNISDQKINLNLTYSPSKVPTGGSDYAPFAAVGIPVLYFMAAMHPDYHQPSDEVSKINWDKMTEIIKTGYLDIWELANGNEYLIPTPEK
jgi:hypothetical protein